MSDKEDGSACYLCPYCSELASFDGWNIHTGNTYTCKHCGKKSVFTVVREDHYNDFAYEMSITKKFAKYVIDSEKRINDLEDKINQLYSPKGVQK